MTLCPCRGMRSLTTGPDGNPKSSRPAAGYSNHAQVGKATRRRRDLVVLMQADVFAGDHPVLVYLASARAAGRRGNHLLGVAFAADRDLQEEPSGCGGAGAVVAGQLADIDLFG